MLLLSFDPLGHCIALSIEKQMAYPHVDCSITSVGKGKNVAYLEKLNERYGFFDLIEALPHPRWVMQYRRKEKAKQIENYLSTLKKRKR